MNRNNIFMRAYIIFIFVCLCVRPFWGYPLWGSVVLAITLSSIFFAIEDLKALCAQTLKEQCDIGDDYIISSKVEISQNEKLIEKVNLFVKEKGGEYDLTDLQKYFDEKKDTVSKIIEHNEEIEKVIKIKRSSQKKYEKDAEKFLFMGYFVLFCTLIFSPEAVPTLFQEMLSVLSFGIILATQQRKDKYAKIIENEIKNSNKVLDAQEMARQDRIQREIWFSQFSDYIESREKQKNRSTMEEKNAN